MIGVASERGRGKGNISGNCHTMHGEQNFVEFACYLFAQHCVSLSVVKFRLVGDFVVISVYGMWHVSYDAAELCGNLRFHISHLKLKRLKSNGSNILFCYFPSPLIKTKYTTNTIP